jgi:4-amino-4-deoxy-L-arabinose transferase-like glycosyltransferase
VGTESYFFEKPPVFYWIGVGLYQISETFNLELVSLIRGINALFGFGIVLFSYLSIAKKNLLGRGLILIGYSSIPVLFLFSPAGTLATHNFRSADTDILQILLIVSCIFIAKSYKRNSLTSAIIGAISGLAILVKGPLGVIGIVLYLLITQKQFELNRDYLLNISRHAAISGFSMLAVILPWHLYMWLNFGQDFIQKYFLYHLVSRTTSALEGHNQPIYFYLKFIINPQNTGIIPFVLIGGILSSLRNKIINKTFLSGVGLIIIFSILGTKISWYLLPIYPLLIIGGAEIISLSWDQINSVLISLTGIYYLVCIIFIVIGILNYSEGIQNYQTQTKTLLVSNNEAKLHRVFHAIELINPEIYEIKYIDDKTIPRENIPVIIDVNEFQGKINPDQSETDSNNYVKL